MKALSFDDYPLRIFVANRQLSVQPLEFTHQYQKKHRIEIEKLPLTQVQKDFFITLLETPGVIKITLRVNEVWVWKWPGYEWYDIEPGIQVVLNNCAISAHDLEQEIKLAVQESKQMALIHIAPYFQRYLRFSIAIFHRKYPLGSTYRDHPKWNDFLNFLQEVVVEKIIICLGQTEGGISQQYFCCPITKSTPSEEYVRERYCIFEEILLH